MRANMSNKRKRAELDAKRSARRKTVAAKRLAKLAAEGRVAYGEVIPKGAIAADLSQQAPNNTYSPKTFYIDQPFQCVDCGKEEVWTATQQKWYYEVAKGPIHARAIRCRTCRQRQRQAKEKHRQRSQRKR